MASAVAVFISAISSPSLAQTPPTVPPVRSDAWNQATTILALSSAGFELLMPRVFYSDPEVTAGWKARWHVSALAPIMTLATLTLVNEHNLKQSFEGRRPGCDDTNGGMPGCTSYGMMSSQTFLAFGALGQGTAVFLVDTLKWSDGRFNGGALAGEIGVPLVLGVITAAGRGAGNWESAGQVWTSAGVGLVSGMLTGLTYSLLQRPECGYTGSFICW